MCRGDAHAVAVLCLLTLDKSVLDKRIAVGFIGVCVRNYIIEKEEEGGYLSSK